jgi:predicted nucleotidyltransferase
MKILPRFFIKTKDKLFFAVNTYHHPESHYVAFLRYVPDENGERISDGVRYKKVSSQEAYDYLNKYHPDYLFDWNIDGKKTMGVLKEDVEEILNPLKKLNEIINSNDDNELFNKIRLLAKTFHEGANIDYNDMGISGSTLLNLQNSSTSDIDFIVFGKENHKRAIKLYSKLKEDDDSPLDKINNDYWSHVYDKRIKDNSMTLEEFIWYESRKNNRGLIKGTLFDISFTLKEDEIGEEEEIYFKPLERIKIKCEIIDDDNSYAYPAIYLVSNVEFLKGNYVNIEKIVSYTHTYTGIVKNNERVIASGVCEEVTKKDSTKCYNLVIGTTRESIGEYLKLEKNPI